MHVIYVLIDNITSPTGLCPVIKHIVISAEKRMNVHTK